ncbi:MAG: hypothetical protein ABIK39_02470 [candidate division WOR-3 bacterium]
MSGRAGRLGIPIVAVLSIIALLYLALHSWNIKLTKQLVESERKQKLAFEKAESLEIELRKLMSFSRLESLALKGEHFPQVSPPDGSRRSEEGRRMPGVLRVASDIRH